MSKDLISVIETHCILCEDFKDELSENKDLVLKYIELTLKLIDKESQKNDCNVETVLELRDRISNIRLSTGINEYKSLEDKLLEQVQNKFLPI